MAVRNLMLQFGMIQAQVSMVKATDERNKVEFKQVHDCGTGSLHTINYKKICSGCTKEVPLADIKKGYEVSKGTYMHVPDNVLESVRVPTNGALIIQEVVPVDAVFGNPTLFTGDVYFLTPPTKEKFPPTAFAVLREALRGHVAMARTSMYNREYTCAITVSQHGLKMYTLRYPGEMRAEPKAHLPPVDPNHVELAKRFVENIRSAQPKLDYPDSYNEGVAKVVANLMAGVGPTKDVPAPAPVPTTDIEAMLKAMASMGKAGAPVQEPAEQPAADKPSKAKSKKGKKVA